METNRRLDKIEIGKMREEIQSSLHEISTIIDGYEEQELDSSNEEKFMESMQKERVIKMKLYTSYQKFQNSLSEKKEFLETGAEQLPPNKKTSMKKAIDKIKTEIEELQLILQTGQEELADAIKFIDTVLMEQQQKSQNSVYLPSSGLLKMSNNGQVMPFMVKRSDFLYSSLINKT